MEKKVQCLYLDDQTPDIPDVAHMDPQHFTSLYQEHLVLFVCLFAFQRYEHETQTQKLNKEVSKVSAQAPK